MAWPSDEEFEAGTKKTGTIKASVETSGQTIDQVIDFVISGGGTETVKVPAGEFDARLLKQTLTISIPDFGVDGLTMKASSWLAPGTGLVRTEIPNILGEGSISMELVKFTPGE